MRALPAVALLLVALSHTATAQAAPRLVEVGDFDQPVHVAAAPGDPSRVFVVERTGRVQLVVDGRRLGRPFLDLSADVATDDSERGLLSIAFAPDYQSSGRFYVYLTAEGTGEIQVREYRRADADHADPAILRTLLRAEHPRGNHNGGQLQTGPDARLWVGTGDGGGANDPDANGQRPDGLLAKLLRVDLATGAPTVFAIGLRNPWRFSFDRQTHDLVIADVGQDAVEEVDRVAAAALGGGGLNFGWPCWEGTRRNAGIASPCDPPDDLPPVLQRPHGDDVCSITGGYVVRDPGLPTLAGRYLYGDFCAGRLRSADLADPGSDREEPLPVASASSFGEDGAGRLYVASLDGPVYRLEDPAAPPAPGPGGAAPDTVRPALRTSVNGIRSLASRRRLRLAITTDEPVSATVRGRLRGIGALATVRRPLPAGRTVVKLRISRRTARRVRAALRRKPRVIAALAISLRDDAGNARTARRRVKVRG